MLRAACLALGLAAGSAGAQSLAGDPVQSVLSPHPVAQTMERLQAAVTEAGATVFARVDHGAGAASVGMELRDAELLLFGNPRLGTPILQQDIRAGLILPMRVLVHATPGGGAAIVWEAPAQMLSGLDVEMDDGAAERLAEAVAGFIRAAARPD